MLKMDYSDIFKDIRTPLFRYLAPYTRPDYIRFKHLAMFGPPESGKTCYGYSIAYYVEKMCERIGYPFRVYRSLDLTSIFEELEEKKDLLPEMYLFFFIDDAESRSPSVRTRETLRNIGLHDNIRHKLNSLGMKAGYVTLLYSTQRFKNLAPLMRSGDVLIFKGLNLIVPDEYDFAYKIIGYRGITHLKEWMRQIRMYGRDEYKGYGFIKMMDGLRYVHILNPPKRPRNLIDLWYIPPSRKTVFRDRIRAILLKIYENIDKVPYFAGGRPPYYYISRDFLRSINADIKLSVLAKVTNTQRTVRYIYGRSTHLIAIYNKAKFVNTLRKLLGISVGSPPSA